MRALFVTVIATLMLALTAAAQPALTHITVTEQGSGPDVILIPGLATPRAVYQQEAALLAPHYRLHLVQVDGFGGAPGANAGGPVVQPVVDDIHAYIAAHHLEHPAVIGHSLGGLLAMMLALQHPQDAGRLLIVDSLPYVGLIFNPQATVSALEPQAAAMRARMIAEPPAQYAAGEQKGMARLVRDPEQRQRATAWASAADQRVVAQAMYDDMTTDLRPQLAQIKVPVTVLYPYDAVMGPEAAVRAMYAQAFAALPQGKLVEIPGSYHFIMLDQPAAFHQAVLAFLR